MSGVLLGMVLAGAVAWAASLPAGAEVPVRLQTAVGSKSRVGTAVEAVVIAGPATGALVRGSVVEAQKKSKDQGRAVLRLRFAELAGVPISAQVSSVDNARETVEEEGLILGLRPMRTRPSKVEDVLILAAHAHPIALATLEATKIVLSHELRPEIEFRAGVEMRLELERAVEFTPPRRATIATLAVLPELRAIVDAQPLRTRAAKPPNPSDMTNLMFVGEENMLRAAFAAAGWTTADATTIKTATETFLAVADRHSFRHAPVSLLLLDGAKPDLVFQKQNDTFAMRHHIRIWRRPQTWDGRPVWLAAATHDIGIVFSRTAREFSHKVAADIDLERNKVADDLCFTGAVSARGLVARPQAPRAFTNATGDRLRTDGELAVLVLAATPAARSQKPEARKGYWRVRLMPPFTVLSFTSAAPSPIVVSRLEPGPKPAWRMVRSKSLVMPPWTVLADRRAPAFFGRPSRMPPFTVFSLMWRAARRSKAASTRPFTVDASTSPSARRTSTFPLTEFARTFPATPSMMTEPFTESTRSSEAPRGTVIV